MDQTFVTSQLTIILPTPNGFVGLNVGIGMRYRKLVVIGLCGRTGIVRESDASENRAVDICYIHQ